MGSYWRRAAVALVAGAILLEAAGPFALAHEATSTPATDNAVCTRAAFRVAVDVGHTIDVPGAVSARGVPEYEFNLQLATEIKDRLNEAGFSKTLLLITSGKSVAALFKRVAAANQASADLFLSIHHDSVPRNFLEIWDYEGKARSFSDRFKGHSIFVSKSTHDLKGSLLFGRLLGLQLKARGLQYTPHYTEKFMAARQRELLDTEAGVYRFDQLHVLRTTRMAAVLFEAGSIINRDEELLLRNPEHRGLIAAAVLEAVENFCAARKPQPHLIARNVRRSAAVEPAPARRLAPPPTQP